jgi:hypothetical protein
VFLAFSVVSLIIMMAVEFLPGAGTGFLNAWSVVGRLVGLSPTAGDSPVFDKGGAASELMLVTLVNALIGGLPTFVLERFA